MRIHEPLALAAEYRRRGWKNIAAFIEKAEEGIRIPEVMLLLHGLHGRDAPHVHTSYTVIREPYDYFHCLLECMLGDGSCADYQISLVDESLGKPDNPLYYLEPIPTLH